jgi:hypothetical protein
MFFFGIAHKKWWRRRESYRLFPWLGWRRVTAPWTASTYTRKKKEGRQILRWGSRSSLQNFNQSDVWAHLACKLCGKLLMSYFEFSVKLYFESLWKRRLLLSSFVRVPNPSPLFSTCTLFKLQNGVFFSKVSIQKLFKKIILFYFLKKLGNT